MGRNVGPENAWFRATHWHCPKPFYDKYSLFVVEMHSFYSTFCQACFHATIPFLLPIHSSFHMSEVCEWESSLLPWLLPHGHSLREFVNQHYLSYLWSLSSLISFMESVQYLRIPSNRLHCQQKQIPYTLTTKQAIFCLALHKTKHCHGDAEWSFETNNTPRWGIHSMVSQGYHFLSQFSCGLEE